MTPQHRIAPSGPAGGVPALAAAAAVLCIAGSALADVEGGHADLWRFVEPTGIVTLSLAIITAGLAVLRKRSPRLLLKLHKIFAALTLLSAVCHATLVFLSE